MKMANCLLNIIPSYTEEAELKYMINSKLGIDEISKDNSFIKFDSTTYKNSLHIEVSSEFTELKFCNMELHLPVDLHYGNFKFECIGQAKCVIVSDLPSFSLNSIKFFSNNINSSIKANIRTIRLYDRLEFIAKNEGAVYL